LGETPDEVMLGAMAELADGWNSAPISVAGLRERLARVEAACAAIGRPLSDLELSLETQVLIAPTRGRVAELLDGITRLGPAGAAGADVDLATLEDQWLVGTPDEVIARIGAYRALGISHFLLWFMDFPNMEGVRLLAETVMPHFQGQWSPKHDR
jgi:alkanesulfonate monooxygenase SsuD/methylene tetrahydromethanopterin reductase-like flavin-dependent oxidoreductase (luciferase family)